VGPATSVAGVLPHALKMAAVSIAKRKYLTRTGYTPEIKNVRIILPDFVKADWRKKQACILLKYKEMHNTMRLFFDLDRLPLVAYITKLSERNYE
jgi:hypothetical protein